MTLFLYCAYQLFYTNVVAQRSMSSEMDALHKEWATAAKVPATLGGTRMSAPRPASVTPFDTADAQGNEGKAFAIIHIPRLGQGFEAPILEGTSLDYLGRGVGHYHGSAMPGQIGNFAVAGHRKTHGEPFRNLDQMRAGDFIVVETADTWYIYREDRDPFIVDPTDLAIVAPVPDHPWKKPTAQLITLTTCNPWWASTQRMIVVGHLIASQPRSAGEPVVLHASSAKFE